MCCLLEREDRQGLGHCNTRGGTEVGRGRSRLRAPTPLHGLAPLNLESRTFGLSGTHSGVSQGSERGPPPQAPGQARARMGRWGPGLGLWRGRGWGVRGHRYPLPCPRQPGPLALVTCSAGALPELLRSGGGPIVQQPWRPAVLWHDKEVSACWTPAGWDTQSGARGGELPGRGQPLLLQLALPHVFIGHLLCAWCNV